MFADDFVGVSESKDQLQTLIDVVHAYCRKWRLKANVSKSAVMVFSVDGAWKWREHVVSKYTYLGVDFTSTGVHRKNVLDNGRRKVN